MKYNTINSCECTNGLGWGVSLFTQGCSLRCPGCFNPETWDFNGGKQVTTQVESELYKLMDKPYITRFSILGGEPFAEQNLEQLSHIILTIRANYPDIKIWI
jgi:anaerobic ribonucleoside-triphosphate reductase activating protein